jgi:hypothetical protein
VRRRKRKERRPCQKRPFLSCGSADFNSNPREREYIKPQESFFFSFTRPKIQESPSIPKQIRSTSPLLPDKFRFLEPGALSPCPSSLPAQVLQTCGSAMHGQKGTVRCSVQYSVLYCIVRSTYKYVNVLRTSYIGPHFYLYGVLVSWHLGIIASRVSSSEVVSVSFLVRRLSFLAFVCFECSSSRASAF